jgi:hypothetical protein
MRFRPANISVINRRASSEAVIVPAVQNPLLKAHQQDHVPPTPPVETFLCARTGARPQGFTSPRQTTARP